MTTGTKRALRTWIDWGYETPLLLARMACCTVDEANRAFSIVSDVRNRNLDWTITFHQLEQLTK